MIKINLLPVREERRRMGARQEQMFFVLILILVFIGVFYWHSSTNKKIKSLRSQITQVENDIKRLNKAREGFWAGWRGSRFLRRLPHMRIAGRDRPPSHPAPRTRPARRRTGT